MILFITAVFTIIIALLLQKMQAERRAYEHQKQMEAERLEHQRRQEEAHERVRSA